MKVEILRSKAFPKELAVTLDDYRVAGAKAGPWDIVKSWIVPDFLPVKATPDPRAVELLERCWHVIRGQGIADGLAADVSAYLNPLPLKEPTHG